jgi:hypothetical protein
MRFPSGASTCRARKPDGLGESRMREIRTSGLMSGMWKRSTVRLLRHRLTKGPATDRPNLTHRATSRLDRFPTAGRHSSGATGSIVPTRSESPSLRQTFGKGSLTIHSSMNGALPVMAGLGVTHPFPFIGRPTADLFFDSIQCRHPFQRFFRDSATHALHTDRGTFVGRVPNTPLQQCCLSHSNISPQPRLRFSVSWRQHRNRYIIAVQFHRAQNILTQRIGQRL